jgi:hypothetical protein
MWLSILLCIVKQTSPTLLLKWRFCLFNYLEYIIFFLKLWLKLLPSVYLLVASLLLWIFCSQDSSNPVCKSHNRLVCGWFLVAPTEISHAICPLCKHSLSKGSRTFTSKPEPSVVSDLDGGCTWMNGTFSKQYLAWSPDKGYLSSRFYSSVLHPQSE